MRNPRSEEIVAGSAAGARSDATAVRTLVMSRHDAVRRHLVEYLNRSPGLQSCGETFAPDALGQTCPDVLVLDISQVDGLDLDQILAAAGRVGTRVIALASIRDSTSERAVVEAGGLYRLKTAGADGLAEAVRDLAQASPGPAGRGPGWGTRASTSPG